MQQPLFSVIIATYNAAGTLEKCLQRVKAQDYTNFELLVIDGKSTDGTLHVIERNKIMIAYFISEPDKGIYDAWNKGLLQAKGEWIVFIGADDFLLPDTLSSYAAFIRMHAGEKTFYISSKVQLISAEGQKRRVFGWPWRWNEFRRKHTVAHTGSLHRNLLFKTYGFFDARFKIAGDYELLLRPKENLNAAFLNKITVEMSEAGMSTNVGVCVETRQAQLLNQVGSAYLINLSFIEQLLKLSVKKLLLKLSLNTYLRKEFQG